MAIMDIFPDNIYRVGILDPIPKVIYFTLKNHRQRR